MIRYVYVFGMVVLIVVGLTVLAARHTNAPSDSVSVAPSLVNRATLGALKHASLSAANTSHLAAGLQPPTNSWFSGMVLQATPEPVYPSPLSFLAKDTGFEIGLPTITSSATEIDGQHTAGIAASLNADHYNLVRYDKLSATLQYRQGNRAIGALTLSEGSPFVFFTAQSATTILISQPAHSTEMNAHYLRYSQNGQTYVIYSPQASMQRAQGMAISLQKGQTVTFYALPSDRDILKPYAANIVRAVQTSHASAKQQETTSFSYQTTNKKATVFAVPAYETASNRGPVIGQFQSIYGPMKLLTGTSFTTSVPSVNPSNRLDISKLSSAQKEQLIRQLASDVATTKIDQQDSYYAGKQLARAANLLDIAEQLHQTASVQRLHAILLQAFAARLNNTYFYYDTTLHGIAPTVASFGSQNFNDHHFHYGYWLYAASILGRYDHAFVGQYRDRINLLAADIANYQATATFPATRYYDPYAGHSWADGLAPFADGNNQESSSEAIHAWNGVTLWGQLTNNAALTNTGRWMLANENHTAQTTWRTVDTGSKPLQAYASPVVGIAFSGKRTYNTWFSDQAAAKLAIQLIPMDPSMAAIFKTDPQINQTVAASIQNSNYNVPLGDYALLYLALANPTQAASLADQQTVIDDGNSKTYLQAFIFTQSKTVAPPVGE